MDKIVIEGHVVLRGEIAISGAKNAALPIMAASILTETGCELENIPRLFDISTMKKVLESFNVAVSFEENLLKIDNSRIEPGVAPYDLVRTMRASICVMGPLLARFGKVKVSLPGGCAIGTRPINLHLKGLEAMGATVKLGGGYIEAKASKLTGNKIYLDFPSVGATENLMMAACLAEGETLIENAALEPEITDLADFLNQAGARIQGAGTNVIHVHGVSRLTSHKQYRIIPDRIEAGTYMVAAAITGGDLLLKGVIPEHLEAHISNLEGAGVEFTIQNDSLRVSLPDGRQPLNLSTRPYPGFPTDLQAQMMALACVTKGTSQITETIFENRFMHVAELKRLGADIKINDATATINGVDYLSGAPVMATDLRASAALILAGLVARGRTEVRRVYHLDRGYEKIEQKLAAVGARICRKKED